MANLAGMYPTGIPGKDYPSSKQWPSHWTPIPVHTVENEEDFVILINFFFKTEKNQIISIFFKSSPVFSFKIARKT